MCKNTLIAPKTTEDDACLNLSSNKFIISNISSFVAGLYLLQRSRTTA